MAALLPLGVHGILALGISEGRVSPVRSNKHHAQDGETTVRGFVAVNNLSISILRYFGKLHREKALL